MTKDFDKKRTFVNGIMVGIVIQLIITVLVNFIV